MDKFPCLLYINKKKIQTENDRKQAVNLKESEYTIFGTLLHTT